MAIEIAVKNETFTELIADLKAKGFVAEHQRVDAMIITLKKCRRCRRRLSYEGLSNAVEYHACGHCVPCGTGEIFWTEKSVLRFPSEQNLRAAQSRQFE